MSNKIACFISFSNDYNNIQKFKKIESLVSNSSYYINYSEKIDKRSFSDETIWKYLHDRIAGSSCTILLLTEDLFKNNKYKISYKLNDFINSGWVYNEISASLRDWKDNRINGLVCVIDDHIKDSLNGFSNVYYFLGKHYNLPEILNVNKKYIIFTTYSNFIREHYKYIDMAIENRKKQISSNGKEFKIIYDLHNKNK